LRLSFFDCGYAALIFLLLLLVLVLVLGWAFFDYEDEDDDEDDLAAALGALQWACEAGAALK